MLLRRVRLGNGELRARHADEGLADIDIAIEVGIATNQMNAGFSMKVDHKFGVVGISHPNRLGHVPGKLVHRSRPHVLLVSNGFALQLVATEVGGIIQSLTRRYWRNLDLLSLRSWRRVTKRFWVRRKIRVQVTTNQHSLL